MKSWTQAILITSVTWNIGCGLYIGSECDSRQDGGGPECRVGVCVQGQCREPSKTGEPCIAMSQCTTRGDLCYREDPTIEEGICHPLLKEGQICRKNDTSAFCGFDVYCHKGKCVKPRAENASCTIGNELACQPGLVCWPPNNISVPITTKDAETLDYDSGTCIVGGKEGTRCDNASKIYCGMGYICNKDNFCQKASTQ